MNPKKIFWPRCAHCKQKTNPQQIIPIIRICSQCWKTKFTNNCKCKK